MLEHLVEGHVNGSYYVSNRDPKVIEAYCETCGDSDEILTSWNPDEKNARLNALLKLLMADNLNTREDIYNSALQNSFICQWYGNDIITSLLNDVEDNNDKVFDIASSLLENKIITEKEFDVIMHISDSEKDRQIKMIKYFEKSMFTVDNKTGEKVLKK